MVSSYPRGWGVTCFNSFGFETTTWITFAAGLLLLPLIAALDNKKLQESYAVGASRRLPDRAAAQTETKKKGLLGNICLTALPLALLTGCTYFLQTLITTYGPVYATNNGFDWATGTAIGGTIAGVITVLIGFLCDIVNPFALVVVAFTCHLASPLHTCNHRYQRRFCNCHNTLLHRTLFRYAPQGGKYPKAHTSAAGRGQRDNIPLHGCNDDAC